MYYYSKRTQHSQRQTRCCGHTERHAILLVSQPSVSTFLRRGLNKGLIAVIRENHGAACAWLEIPPIFLQTKILCQQIILSELIADLHRF